MWRQLAQTAVRQAGVVTTRQAVACGISANRLARRAQCEGWRRLAAGVYLLPGHLLSIRALLFAGVLAAREANRAPAAPRLAAVTGEAAAFLLGITSQPPRELQIVIPHDQAAPRVTGVRFRRSRFLVEDDIQDCDGLPCASLARLTVDLAPSWTAVRLRRLLTDARQRRHDLRPVAEKVMDHRSFPGRARLARAVAAVGSAEFDGEFTREVARWLASEGITTVAEFPIETAGALVHADLAVVEVKIAIECDGFGAHSARTQLSADARRSNGLALRRDWIVLRLTWDQWASPTERARFLHTLRAAIALRQAEPA